jgi:hypothetical protein
MLYQLQKRKADVQAPQDQRANLAWTRAIVSRTTWIVYALVFSATGIMISILISVSMENMLSREEKCFRIFSQVGIIVLSLFVVQMLIVLEFLRRLRTVEEQFRIRQELLVFFSLSVSTFVWGCLNFFDPEIASIAIGVFVLAPSYLLVLFSFWYVSFLAWKARGSRVPETTTAASSTHSGSLQEEFMTLVKEETGFKALSEFLHKELSMENLLFLEEVILFERLMETSGEIVTEEIKHKISFIDSQFLRDSSTLCVNLSFGARTAVIALIEKQEYSTSMFKRCEKEIVELILRDSYRRFRTAHDDLIKRIMKAREKYRVTSSA